MRPVLLIQTRGYALDSVSREMPLALLSLASFICKEYDVTIIDQRLTGWKDKLIEGLRKTPVCVGITSLTGEQITYALEAAKLVRAGSDAKIVWGGIHASSTPEQTIQHELVDIVVQGEGKGRLSSL